MADIFTFNLSNDAAIPPQGNEAVAKKQPRQSVGVRQRKGLADITNLQSKPPKVSDKGKLVLMCDQELIQQLRQENETLRKQLVERNKMVELYGIEIQKLRGNVQKSQQQNLQLAQANSQILYQLNTSKDKLKVLEHELACRNTLLAAKSLELLEVKKAGQCQVIDSKRATSKEAAVSSLADGNNDKPCSTNSGQHSRDIYSAVGIQSAANGTMAEEDPDSRRYQKRRQSSRFESVDLEPAEDMPDTHGVALQSMDKRSEAFPMSETTGEGSREAFVSSSADIDGSRLCTNKDKHPRKAKRESNVKHASNGTKFETKRPRTRSSMLKSEEQQEDFKVDAKFVETPLNDNTKLEARAASISPSVNTKDVVKEEADLSVAQEVIKIQDSKVTLPDGDPCSSGTEIGQLRATGLPTLKGTSQVEKTEIKSPCSGRQSSRLECKDEEPSGCHRAHPQNGNKNEKPENDSLQMSLLKNSKKMERQETAALPELVKRPSRRAAEKVQSYKEIPLKTKMRRPG